MQCPECGGTRFLATMVCAGSVDVIVDADNTYVEDQNLDYLQTYCNLDWGIPEGPYVCASCVTRDYTREELDEVQFKKEKAKTKEPVLRGGELPEEDE